MRNLRCYVALPVFLSLILVLSICLYAQTKTLDRKYDPVIVAANALSGFESSDFAGVAIGQIFAMTFDSSAEGWQAIPFQIDERDTSGSYFTADQVSGFDLNDELVFMAADAGDSAIGWLNNADSEQYQRFAIKITDPLSPDKKGWVYLYRSSTLSPSLNTSQGLAQCWVYLFRSSSLKKEFSEDYVTYSPPPGSNADDMVAGETYTVGSATNGFMNFLSFPQSPSINVLERQKIRGTTTLILLLTFDEDDFGFESVQVIDGPVRVIRELVVNLAGVLEVTLPFQYFKSFVSLSGEINIATSLPLNTSITKIQHTLDVTTNAINPTMTFTNPNNSLTVDGQIDSPNTIIEKLPEFNYTHVTGSQGTIVQLFAIPSTIGDSQDLFYRDELNIRGEPGDGHSIG